MTPEWTDAFQYATKLADSLKLEMAISSSPGWSESGGPWVKSKDGMKKVVWSETYLIGGQRFSGTIKAPPSSTGEFQNLSNGASGSMIPQYYQDIAIIAYKLPENEISLSNLNPQDHFKLGALYSCTTHGWRYS